MSRLLAIAGLVVGVFLLHGVSDPALHDLVVGSVDLAETTGGDHGMRHGSHPMEQTGAACAVVCSVAVLAVARLAARRDCPVDVRRRPSSWPVRSILRGPEPPVPRFV